MYGSGSSLKFNVAAGGNVGIGTTTPLSKLQVYAASTQNNETDAINAFGLSSTVNLSVINSDAMAQYKGGSIGLGGRITTGSNPYLWSVIKGGKENATDSNYAGYLGLWTIAADGTSGERMRITSTGNVGIGTTSPTQKLSVAVSGDTLANFDTTNSTGGYVSFSTSGTNRGYIGTGGSLSTGAALSDFVLRSNSDLIFDISGSPRMKILAANGNVGIGNTSPSYSLDVNGFINTDGTTGGYKQAGNTVLYASTTNTSLAVGASAAAAWMSA